MEIQKKIIVKHLLLAIANTSLTTLGARDYFFGLEEGNCCKRDISFFDGPLEQG